MFDIVIIIFKIGRNRDDDGDINTSLIKKKKSSSLVSKVTSLHSCSLICETNDSFSKMRINSHQQYDLQSLCEYYEVPLPNQASSSKACEILLKSFLPKTPFYDSLVCLDKSVLNVNKLLPLLSSTNERPDVTIYHNDKLVFLAEIDSSSDGNFEAAVQKTIIGAINVIRVFKCVSPENNQFVAFALPKLHTSQVVVKIVLMFRCLFFMYKLKVIEMDIVKSEVLQAMRINSGNTVSGRSISSICHFDRFIVKLSDTELQQFQCTSLPPPVQLKSINGIVVDNHRQIFKKLLKHLTASFASFCLTVNSLDLSRVIKPIFHKSLFSYDKIRYNPLKPTEANACLRNFIMEVHSAIQEIHSVQYAHMDIRLQNICINEQYHAVLIDVDRVTDIDSPALLRNYGLSCMYTIPSNVHPPETFTFVNRDYMQLGYLISYVISEVVYSMSLDYHQMQLSNLPQAIQSDSFLVKLLTEGLFDENLFLSSTTIPISCDTIQQVIDRRQAIYSS